MLLLPFSQEESTPDSAMHSLKFTRDCEDQT